MFRIVQAGTGLPASFICDSSAEFQPGQVAQLTVIGNQVMATVSNGIAPIGIIDDIRTKAFTSVSWNEEVVVPAIGVPGPNNTLITPIDLKTELENPNIDASSFTSTVDVKLNSRNGVITFIAGTVLNFDLLGTGQPNAIRAIVNYTYQQPNIPGDDSTQGSGRMTVWFDRMFIQTDMIETNQSYPVNASLYVSEKGLFTTRKPSPSHPSIAIVTAPPSPLSPAIELLYL
jgi:hypothetical protein